MHPTISQAVATQHIEDFQRAAREQQAAHSVVEARRAARRGFSRYFPHAQRGSPASHFVGRVGELAELELALREAADSRPVVVLLGGESGVGKTRLVREFERRLAPRPTRSSSGAKPSSRATASFPTRRCSARCGRWSAPATRRSTRSAAAAARSSRRCCRGSTTEAAASDRNDPVRRSCACSRRCSSCSTCSARTTPVVLILEDLHWADRSTRDVRRFLARSLRQERVMLVLDLPHRRAPPPPPAAPAARRARAPRARAPDRARPVRPRRAGRGARRHPRRAARATELVERLFDAQRGQPAVHRGAAGGRPRRPRRRSPEPARRVHAADRAPVRRRPARGCA